MKISKNSYVVAAICCAVVPIAFSQPNTAASDAAWAALRARQSTKIELEKAGIADAPDQKISPVDRAIEALQHTAKQAKDFYQRFPSDSRASAARRIEAVCYLRSAELGGVQYGIPAFILADAYRRDSSLAATERFEVALAMETLLRTGQLRAPRLIESAGAYEEIADKLYAEFGAIPDVCAMFQGLLRLADDATALRVAAKLKTMAVPDAVRQSAETAITRIGRKGKPVEELTLASVDGRKIRFDEIRQLTVLYFWNCDDQQHDLALLGRLATTTAGLNWVYVGLGRSQPDLAVLQAKAPFPGTHCLDGSSLGGAAARTFGVQQLPSVAVISKAGLLVGTGPIEALGPLMAMASK